MKHNVDFRMAVRFLQDLKESHCSFTRTRRRSQSLLVPHAAPPLLREPPTLLRIWRHWPVSLKTCSLVYAESSQSEWKVLKTGD